MTIVFLPRHPLLTLRSRDKSEERNLNIIPENNLIFVPREAFDKHFLNFYELFS